ncbi:hypothetical protein Tco_0379178 [Tanacetum coccineum]
MVKGDDEIMVLGEIIQLESGTQKLIEKLNHEKDSQEKALGEFDSTLENVLEKLSQEKDSLDDFYGFMYDTNDDAIISDDPFHETEDLSVELDKAIEDVVV